MEMSNRERRSPPSTRMDEQGEGVPLYRRVRDQLKAELDRGLWKPGDMLPTEAELGAVYGVSVGTVRQAVMSLVREGLIVRRPGKGSFVTRLDGSRSLSRFFRFRESASGKALDPTIRVVTMKKLRAAPAHVAEEMRLGAREPVLFLRRTLVQDNTPICIYDSYMPYDRVAGLERDTLGEKRLYRALEENLGIHVVAAEEKLSAGVASGEEAELLEVGQGTPVMLIERTAYTHNGVVIEWRQTMGRSDQFVYRVRLP
jgi:GntR family transcriptional regulator